MSGATCPSCGVAVVPGYVRCPKCHRALPRQARSSTSPVGGTSLERAGSPMLAIVAAIVIGGGIMAYFALRGGHKAAPQEPAPAPSTTTNAAEPGQAPAAAIAPAATTAAAPSAPRPDLVASELERSLKHAKLWATVSVIGDHVDVRSSACADPAMKPALDAQVGAFKAAGLTKLRCLEQSGAVVFDRDL